MFEILEITLLEAVQHNRTRIFWIFFLQNPSGTQCVSFNFNIKVIRPKTQSCSSLLNSSSWEMKYNGEHYHKTCEGRLFLNFIQI